MVTRLAAANRWAVVSVGTLLGSTAALATGCGNETHDPTIPCAMQDHCTPHGLVCDTNLGVCVAGSAGSGGSSGKGGNGGSNAGGSNTGGNGEGGSTSDGGTNGSGGIATGGGGAGGDAGSMSVGGDAGAGGVAGTGGAAGASGTAGNAGAGGNAGASGNAGAGGSAGTGGKGGTGGSGGTSGAGGSGGAGGGPLVGRHMDESGVDYPSMTLTVTNLGPTISASNVVLRYYFSNEPSNNTWGVIVAYADFQPPYESLTSVTSGAVVANPSPLPGADRILQINVANPGSWTTNRTLSVQVLALPNSFTGLSQANDYSYASHDVLTEWDRFTVTVNGALLWGEPP